MRTMMTMVACLSIVFGAVGAFAQDKDPWDEMIAKAKKCKPDRLEKCRAYKELAKHLDGKPERLREAAGSKDVVLERAALQALGQAGPDSEALGLLFKSLDDQVAGQAVALAANMQQKELCNQMLIVARAAAEAQRHQVLLRSISALGRLQYAEATAFLIEQLSSPHRKINRVAIEALSKVGGDNVFDLLSKFVQDPERSMNTRTAALSGLGRLQAPGATKFLIEQARNEASPLRAAAVSSLAHTGNKGVVAELVDLLSVAELAPALIETLGTLGGVKAASMLMEMHRNEEYAAGLRFQALCAAAKAGAKEALQPLLEALKSSKKDRRQAAIRALGYLGNPEAVEALYAKYKRAKKDEKELILWAIKTSSGKALETEDDIKAFLKERTP